MVHYAVGGRDEDWSEAAHARILTNTRGSVWLDRVIVEERIRGGRLVHLRTEGQLDEHVALWIRGVNAIFAATMLPAFSTTRVASRPLPKRGSCPRVFYSWHAYSWVAHIVIRAWPAESRPLAIAHNGLASQLNHRAGAFLGSDLLVFNKRSDASPRAQIAEAIRLHNYDVMLFADSGGPYRVLKPGLLHIAGAADAELIPFVVHSRPNLRLGRKMKHLMPMPFARLEMVTGAPCPPTSTLAQLTEALHRVESGPPSGQDNALFR